MGNHETLLDSGPGQYAPGLDADNLDAALDFELPAQLGSRIDEFAPERLDDIDVRLGYQFRFTCSVLPALLRKVTSNCFTFPSLFTDNLTVSLGRWRAISN